MPIPRIMRRKKSFPHIKEIPEKIVIRHSNQSRKQPHEYAHEIQTGINPVSYTHLDVYKRQVLYSPTSYWNEAVYLNQSVNLKLSLAKVRLLKFLLFDKFLPNSSKGVISILYNP